MALDSIHFDPPVAPYNYTAMDLVGVEGTYYNPLSSEGLIEGVAAIFPPLRGFKNVEVRESSFFFLYYLVFNV